ncbi:MAG: NAD-dependent protein deacylase [Clostridia bacterium]|nr:NAD-dependent protein deacylase [Clostridia bacterium]
MFEAICERVTKESRFVFFTGAGISTDSGIKDFRSGSGLYSEGYYSGYAPEEILGIDFLQEKPEIFFKFYKDKILNEGALPNKGHKAIACIESLIANTHVVTQNIDGLHSKAGSVNVIELHGSILNNYCMACKRRFDFSYIPDFTGEVPICDVCGGIVRPDVVLYGENLDDVSIKGAVTAIENADFLFAIGSSLTVYPASGLLKYYRGNFFYIINIGQTPYDGRADRVMEVNSSIALGILEQELCNVFG